MVSSGLSAGTGRHGLRTDVFEGVVGVRHGPEPTAAELISHRHRSVPRGSTVAEAAHVLAWSGLPMVPVCEPDGRLVGVLTDRAILTAVALNSLLSGHLVDDLMDADPVFVADYATAEWILVEMDDACTWSVPVTDGDHHLIGIISLPDLVSVVFPALLSSTWNRIAIGRRRH